MTIKPKTLFKFTLLTLFSLQLQAQSSVPFTLNSVDEWLQGEEASVEDLKEDNNAMISWADQPNKQTELAFVYLHGFGASRTEGEPVVSKLSKTFKANVYYARLKGHGRSGTEGFKELTKETYIASAKEALDIGRLLGKKVILISTSTGGTLSLYLASHYKDIAGLVLYSPFVGLKNPMMNQIITPEGRELFKSMIGGEVQKIDRSESENKFWSTQYHINAYVALIGMLQQTMTLETFKAVECPVFMAYYYKNEKEQDQVVSVPAMLEMYSQLGTSDSQKKKQAFPETGNHVIASELRSKDWISVLNSSEKFIKSQIQN